MIDRMISALRASFGDRAIAVAEQQRLLASPDIAATWATISDGLRRLEQGRKAG